MSRPPPAGLRGRPGKREGLGALLSACAHSRSFLSVYCMNKNPPSPALGLGEASGQHEAQNSTPKFLGASREGKGTAGRPLLSLSLPSPMLECCPGPGCRWWGTWGRVTLASGGMAATDWEGRATEAWEGQATEARCGGHLDKPGDSCGPESWGSVSGEVRVGP